MSTWVEDIVQALKNLGGQAHRSDIFAEVQRIRTEPIPLYGIESMHECILAHSSDSAHFQGKDLFKKKGNGVWALREGVESGSTISKTISHPRSAPTNTWLKDIIQALRNLGGQAALEQIDEEVSRIRQGPLPKNWKYLIRINIYQHSPDSGMFKGREIFRRVSKGEWALSEVRTSITPAFIKPTSDRSVPLSSESVEDIENKRRTIEEYREYYDPKSESWNTYIQAIFNILGFSVTTINPRLATLNVIGTDQKPNALVAFIRPEENFDEALPGLTWDSHLLFAASFYQLDWGILTDGLQMKVNQYQDHQLKQTHYWPQFDESVCEFQSATFLSMYKVLSSIKGTINLYTSDSHIKIGQPKKESYNKKPGQFEAVREFLRSLLERARTRTNLHAKTRVGVNNYVSASAGTTGITYHYVAVMDRGNVDLYIDSNDKEWNKSVYKSLFSQKQEIERSFGEELEWQLLPDNRASRVRYTIYGYDLRVRDQWEPFQDRLIDAMIKLDKVIRPIIQNYR